MADQFATELHPGPLAAYPNTMFIINDPAICAEIARLHDAYERALIANEVEALVNFFWSAPEVVRFGVSEHLYGPDAIANYRQHNQPTFTDRKLVRRTIAVFGAETASVMCEISQLVAGKPRQVRQSQVWVNFPETGWKIVAAHVSNPIMTPSSAWETYVDQAAVAVGLPLNAAHRSGVAGQLTRAAILAGPLLDFPLPLAAEPAPVFTA